MAQAHPVRKHTYECLPQENKLTIHYRAPATQALGGSHLNVPFSTKSTFMLYRDFDSPSGKLPVMPSMERVGDDYDKASLNHKSYTPTAPTSQSSIQSTTALAPRTILPELL